MMTPAQKAARLALIKEIAEKQNRQAEFKRKQKINASKVRRWTDVEEKPRRAKSQSDWDTMISKMDENHNQWTDSSSYAKQYYGEVYAETTKFDNDWD